MAMTMMKQMMARKAERALKEILDKADSNYNGKVELKDFKQILQANGVEVGDVVVYCKLYRSLTVCSLRSQTSPSLLSWLTRMERSVRET